MAELVNSPWDDNRKPVNGDTTGCGGKRFNTGKLQWHLLPIETLKEVVQVLQMGAEKYGLGNWQKGMSWLVCWDCLMRHAIAWRNGETKDTESGLNHLSHVIANAMFLLWYTDHKKGVDDRIQENL